MIYCHLWLWLSSLCKSIPSEGILLIFLVDVNITYSFVLSLAVDLPPCQLPGYDCDSVYSSITPLHIQTIHCSICSWTTSLIDHVIFRIWNIGKSLFSIANNKQQKLQLIKVIQHFFLSTGCPIVIVFCCLGSFTNLSLTAFHFFISSFLKLTTCMNYMLCLK